MEYKVLEKKDLVLMKDVLEDDNMVFDLKTLRKFYKDKNTFGFIAKEENKIIGFLYGYDIIHPNGKHAFFIYSVGVLPKYQDKGYGTKLLDFVKNYAKQHGFFEMFVITDKGNPRACHVYEKLGGKNDYENEIVYVYNLSKEEKWNTQSKMLRKYLQTN